jgi:hypothetical protein
MANSGVNGPGNNNNPGYAYFEHLTTGEQQKIEQAEPNVKSELKSGSMTEEQLDQLLMKTFVPKGDTSKFPQAAKDAIRAYKNNPQNPNISETQMDSFLTAVFSAPAA